MPSRHLVARDDSEAKDCGKDTDAEIRTSPHALLDVTDSTSGNDPIWRKPVCGAKLSTRSLCLSRIEILGVLTAWAWGLGPQFLGIAFAAGMRASFALIA